VGIAALLTKRGADARAADVAGQPPVFLAALRGHKHVIKLLLPLSDLRQVSLAGYSLLHTVILMGTPDTLEVILPSYVAAHLVDIPTGFNQLCAGLMGDHTGTTPLMMACTEGKYAFVKTLLQAGASRHVKDSRGDCALMYCSQGPSLACLRLVLGEKPNWHYTPQQVNERGVGGWTAIHIAARTGTPDFCKILIAAGADLRLREFVGGMDARGAARQYWPDKPALADLLDPDGVREAVAAPHCASCQRTDGKLSACSRCHAVRYCSSQCQNQHWREHKRSCVSTDVVGDELMAKAAQTMEADIRRFA
jgi:hypothetical protein